MIKYLCIFFSVFLSITLLGQEPDLIGTAEVELESEFIIALQDVALEEFDDALIKLKKIKDKVHDDGIVDFEIAKIYFIKNELDVAKLYGEKALLKDNSKPIYKQFLIDVAIEQKDYLTAANLMEDLLTVSSFERKKYYRTADNYQKAKKTDKAIAVLANLEKIIGLDQEVELYKTDIYLRNRNYSDALNVVEKFLNSNPSAVKVLEKKAMLFRLMNKNEEAINVYNYILEIDPKNPRAISYTRANRKFNQTEEKYIKNLLPMLNNSEIDIDKKIQMLIPFVTQVSNNSPIKNEMINAAKTLIDINPQSAKTNALYADILFNAGEIKKSIKYYENSLKYNKNNFTIWRQLMDLYTLTEDWGNLKNHCEEAIDYYPNQALGYYSAGKAYINLNKAKKGIEYLDEAILFAGGNKKFISDINLLKSKGLVLRDKIDEAESIINSLDPNFKNKHPFYWEIIGDIEQKKGNLEAAKINWKKSLQLGNNSNRLLGKLK